AAAAGRRRHPGRGVATAARGRAGAAAVRGGRTRGVRPGRGPAGSPRGRPAELRRHRRTAGSAGWPGGRAGPGHDRLPRGPPRQVPACRLGPATEGGAIDGGAIDGGRSRMTTVTGKTLAELNVPVPGYDRRQVTT